MITLKLTIFILSVISLTLISFIIGYKYFLIKNKNLLLNNKLPKSSLVRKYTEVDVLKNKNVFYSGGLMTSLLLAYLVINITTETPQIIDNNQEPIEIITEEIDINFVPPPSLPPPPPPPPPQTIKIDDKIIEIEPKIELKDENKQDNEGNKNGVVDGTGDSIVIVHIDPPKITEPEIFTIVEEQPCWIGCEDIIDKNERKKCSDRKMVSFLAQKAGYPTMAREAGFEGTIHIRFVVEPDGSISNIELLKDNTPGGGLKDAAINAVKSMVTIKKWNPGKQRGNPVRVRIVVPIKFKLQ